MSNSYLDNGTGSIPFPTSVPYQQNVDWGNTFMQHSTNYFNNIDESMMRTQIGSQTDFPYTGAMTVSTFIKNIQKSYALANYTIKFNYLFPITTTKSTQHLTLTLEFNRSIAKETAERAPKSDLLGYEWSAVRNCTTLYGIAATIVYNIGDDGGIGQQLVDMEIQAKQEGIALASIFQAIMKLLAIHNPRYRYLKKTKGDIEYLTAVFKRVCQLWNICKERASLSILERISQSELAEQEGVATEWLIGTTVEAYIRLLPENSDYYIAGNKSDGGFNKLEQLEEITRIANSSITKLDPLKIGKIMMEPLQTYSFKAGVVVLPERRDIDPYEYDSQYTSVKITDSNENALRTVTFIDCIENSFLYEKTTGKLKTFKQFKDQHNSLYDGDNPIDGTDMFWDKNGSTKDRFNHLFTPQNFDSFMFTASSLHSATLKSVSSEKTSSKNNEKKIWGEFLDFVEKNSKKTIVMADLRTFLDANHDVIINTNESKSISYNLDNVSGMCGIFNNINCLRSYSKSENNGDVSIVKNWLDLMDTHVRTLSSMMETDAFTDSKYIKELSSKRVNDYTDKLENWMIHSIFNEPCYLGILKPSVVLKDIKDIKEFKEWVKNVMDLEYTQNKIDFADVIKCENYKQNNVPLKSWENEHYYKSNLTYSGNSRSGNDVMVLSNYVLSVLGNQPNKSEHISTMTKYSNVFKSDTHLNGLLLKLEQYGEQYSSLRPIAVAYLLGEHTKHSIISFYRDKVAPPFNFMLIRPKKVYLTESTLKVQPGGQTLYRVQGPIIQRNGQDINGSHYKVDLQCQMGAFLALEENFVSMDDVLVLECVSGDTTIFTQSNIKKPLSKGPDLFCVCQPLGRPRAPQFVDLTGLFKSHTIPSFERYDMLWGLKQEDKDEYLAAFDKKYLPNDIKSGDVKEPRVYFAFYEPHLYYTETKDWKERPENGLFKTISDKFFVDYYVTKAI